MKLKEFNEAAKWVDQIEKYGSNGDKLVTEQYRVMQGYYSILEDRMEAF